MKNLAVILLMFTAVVASAQTPATAVAQALADAKKLPPEVAYYTRYLDLSELLAAEREDAYRVLSGHLQHLSRESDITRPVIVPGTAGGLLRLNIEDYGWKVDLWEQLEKVDPYFHAQVITETKEITWWPGGNYNGVYYPVNAFRVYELVKKKQTVSAPWLGDAKNIAALIRLTQSRIPIVRGAWFFNQTAAQQERKPGYYDFLEIKDEKTFQAVIGFDAKLAAKFGNDLRSSVADSGVTLQPRAIVRQATLGGGYWRSLDFRLALDKGNPLRVLGKDIEEKYDATEQYGHLPNGFWATGLFDKQGKRQDAAPDFIASDGQSKSNDRRVHVNVSCVRCHVNGGLKEIDDWTRNLLQPPLALNAVDYKELRKLRQQYLRHLEPFLDRDRAVYAASVKEATGWDTKKYAQQYATFWERYEDARVDAAWAARDLGVSEKKFVDAVYAQVKLGTADTVLSVFVLKGPRVRTIGIRQWLEVYPIAQQYVAQVQGVKK